MGFFDRITKPFRSVKASEDQSPIQNDSTRRVEVQWTPRGSSGIEIFGGYYSEDYLAALRGPQVAKIFDKMRRSDATIKMVTQSVKNPIKGAKWSVEPAEADNEEEKQIADLCAHILFNDLGEPWTQKLHEILTVIDFGFSAFEVTNKLVIGHKKFGTYNGIKSLGYRSQKTIERWNLDPDTGKLCSVCQIVNGDLGRYVTIPSDFLVVFTLDREGDNYEGVSMLRPCFGAWKRKDSYLKIMAIGMEKYAVPTPIGTVPAGFENSDQVTRLETILEKYCLHEKQYIVKPEGFNIEFSKSEFDVSKCKEAIDMEDQQIVRAFLANFLLLGQTGAGSWALSEDLSDFFLGGIEHLASNICETINQTLIPHIVKLNFGPRENYPKLKCTDISDKAGKELSDVIKALVDSKVIIPDDNLEADLRKRYKLPEASMAGQRKIEPKPLFSEKVPRGTMHLADKPKTAYSLIGQQADELLTTMQDALKPIGQKLIKDLMAKWTKATDSQIPNITRQVSVTGQNTYRDAILSKMALIAGNALVQAQKEIGATKVKLSEKVHGALRLAGYSSLADLPESIQAKLKQLADLMVETNLSDLQNDILFQFASSAGSTDSQALIEKDLLTKLDQVIEGSSIVVGATNVASQVVNDTRKTLFEDPEVSDLVGSFTFTNPDPVSPICQDLVGTTFAKDDPNLDRYYPPLHHNCKSYIVANPPDSKKEIEPLGPSSKSLEKYITLAESSMQVQAVDVSKTVASNTEEAKRIASEITDDLGNQSENETAYRFEVRDPSLIAKGTLRSFAWADGVTVWVGRISSETGPVLSSIPKTGRKRRTPSLSKK